MNGIYIKVNDEKSYNEAALSAFLSPWQFCFPVPKGIDKSCSFSAMKEHFRGNSKLLLHLFHNSITGKFEMQVTTASIEKSFPQNRSVKLPIYDLNSVNYDFCCSIFGTRA